MFRRTLSGRATFIKGLNVFVLIGLSGVLNHPRSKMMIFEKKRMMGATMIYLRLLQII